MRAKPGSLFVIQAVLLLPALILGQEGHPLVGSWHGDRGATGTNRSPITLIMDWDGQEITGLVNPGYEHMKLQNAKLNPKGWTVHFELDSKDSTGASVRCMVDGKIDKLGSDRRTPGVAPPAADGRRASSASTRAMHHENTFRDP